MITLNGSQLTPSLVAAVASGQPVQLCPVARDRMNKNAGVYLGSANPNLLRRKWAWLVGGEVPSTTDKAVERFIIGHCAAIGPPLTVEEVRALMVVRANVLCVGCSGVRADVVERLLLLLNEKRHPVVPSLGAVGAAGNSILAHLTRAAFGLGGACCSEDHEAEFLPCELVLTEKESLALINGSSLGTALAALAVHHSERLLHTALFACALSMEVVRADRRCLSERAAIVRNQPGVVWASRSLQRLTKGSELVVDGNRADAFSVRCAPVVLGTVRDCVLNVQQIVTNELNAAVDNPLVFDDGEVIEAGLFHGAPIGLCMDHLKIAMVQLASISERRIFRLTYGQLSGLPSFLLPDSGATSGLMLAQYTAASVLSEAKGLCMPNSVDSLPTVQHLEDHVSMSAGAAQTALLVVERVADVLAIELMAAAQGLDFRIAGEEVDEHGVFVRGQPVSPGEATLRGFAIIRTVVPRWTDDRVLYTDLQAVRRQVEQGLFSELIERWELA